jgi:hypothetical protein
MLNLVATGSTGPGNLRATAWGPGTPVMPIASVINFGAVSGLVSIANGLALPVCDPAGATCTDDLYVQTFVSNTHLVVDVVGYFSSVKGVLMGAQAPLETSGSSVRLSSTGCAAGYVWKWNGSAWACSPDLDTNTLYSAGTGLTLSGTTFSVNPSALGKSPVLSWYDSWTNGIQHWLVAGWRDIHSASITAPPGANGSVLAIATGELQCYNNCVNMQVLHILTDVAGGQNGVSTTDYLVSADSSRVHPTLLGVFSISAGATKTIYWRTAVANWTTWGDVALFSPKIVLTFVPN